MHICPVCVLGSVLCHMLDTNLNYSIYDSDEDLAGSIGIYIYHSLQDTFSACIPYSIYRVLYLHNNYTRSEQ